MPVSVRYFPPGPRTADKFGHVPMRGAIAEHMRLNGRSRPTVLADLRAGRLCVNSAGKIAPTPGAEAVIPRREPGRHCVLPLTAGANHGALARARAKFRLGVRPMYLRLERGEFVIGVDGEFVPVVAPVPPASDLAGQRAAIKQLVSGYVADAIAAGLTAEDAVNGVVSDLRCLVHDAAWSTP